jgi:hypothetical protein
MYVGILKSSFYRICWHTIFAFYDCKLTFPQTCEECWEAASGFTSISPGEAIVNCVGAIDGYILHTEAPYFSGHYQQYGVNI